MGAFDSDESLVIRSAPGLFKKATDFVWGNLIKKQGTS